MSEVTPAATLILLRDMPAGPPEILMVQRGEHLAFAGGNMVFPGGKIDADDRSIALASGLVVTGEPIEPDDLVARVAAIRETLEEAGLAPGIDRITTVDQLEAIRSELHGGRPFSEILRAHQLQVDPYQLTPFARWLPQAFEMRRFDTRFYIAAEPALGDALADGVESSRHCWLSADDHIKAGKLIFPTRRNLERLAQIDSVVSAVEFCGRYPIRIISPQIVKRDGARWLCLPEDLGYPVTAQLLAEVMRGQSEPPSPGITRAPG